MPIFSAAETTIDIGQVLAAKSTDFVENDFSGQSWVNISWVESIGAFGDESGEINFEPLSEGRTQKLKGVRNAGTLALAIGIDYDDDGQATLRGAQTEIFDYAFRVTFNDAPSGGTPSYRYFIGKVMSARERAEGPNTVLMMDVSIGINSNIVVVDASS